MKKTFRVLRRIAGWTAVLALVAGAVLVFVGIKYYDEYQARAAAFDLSKIGEVSQRSVVYDVDSNIYSYLHGQNRMVIPLESVSGWFIQALIAREDSRFWEHNGIDYKGVLRAAVTNFREGEVRQGASTLTQQLARNALELNAESYDRKALEAMLAWRIERTFDKKKILELYLNRIYFGSGFYGLETASRGYFNKSASELNLSESAMLAGIICSPNRLSPRRNLEGATVERDIVLDRMMELNMIGSDDAAQAKGLKLAINHTNPLHFQEDYVMDAVHRDLAEVVAPEQIELGGLKIYTTIDPALQKAAMEAADRQLTKIEEGKNYPHPRKADFVPGVDEKGVEKPTNYLQASLVAIDNRTGAIRAIVGGRDYQHSKYSRAVLSKRQIGSTFKPFVYAAAFRRGMLPGTLVSDNEIAPNELQKASQKWSPQNSDGEYTGLQPAAWGLVKSRNTMAVRVGQFAGLQSVHQLADSVGIGESMPDLPVSYLGAFETTLRELTAAYTIFPNAGVYRNAHLISRVESAAGKVLFETDPGNRQVIPTDAAWMTSTALQEVMTTGTAAKAKSLGWKKPSGGKTGTTNDFFDAWFVGYTTSVTCGVWVGMDQPQTILEKGYGSALALPIWTDFMEHLPEKTYPAAKFPVPVQLVQATLCTASGARANSVCVSEGTAYTASLPKNRVPSQPCTVHREPAPLYATQTLPGNSRPAPQPVAPAADPAPYSTQNLPPSGNPGPLAVREQPQVPATVSRSNDGSVYYENGVEVVGRTPDELARARAIRAEQEATRRQQVAMEGRIPVRRATPVRRAVTLDAAEDAAIYRAEPVMQRGADGDVPVRRAIPAN